MKDNPRKAARRAYAEALAKGDGDPHESAYKAAFEASGDHQLGTFLRDVG